MPSAGPNGPPNAAADYRSSLLHQRMLAEFGTRALREGQLAPLQQEAARLAAAGTGTGRAKVLCHRPATNDLLITAGVGWRAGVVGHVALSGAYDTPVGRALLSRQPVMIPDIEAEPQWRYSHLLKEHGVRALLNVPIGTEAEVWGVLEVDGSQPGAFPEHDLLFLQGLANLLGAVIKRNEAEERARLERAQLEAVLAHLPSGVSIAEAPSGRLLMHNAKGMEIIGHPLLETASYEGYARYGALHEDGTPYRPEEYPIARTVLTGETVDQEPMIYRRGDGGIIHMLVSAAPVHGDDGRVALAVSTFQDVTERRRQEAALARSAARYRATFELAAIGIAHVGLDGRWMQVNDRLCEITGYPRDELFRLTFADITVPEDLDADLAQLRRLRDGEITSYAMEKRYRRKDGSTVWVTLAVSLVRGPGGEPLHYISVIEDISPRKRAEAEREELLRQKDMLMREMNHRIKNSLQMVSHLVHMQGGAIDDPDTRWRFQETETRIATIARVHERLYRHGDLQAIEFGPYLLDLCRDLADTLGLAEGQLNVDAEDAALPPDTALPLGLIVNELVTNAVKYAFPGGRRGRVDVRFARVGDRLRLSVRDNGVGLPAGFAPEQSAGLGMRMLQALSLQLDAELRVEPNGGGAGFVVELPAAPAS